MSDEINNFNNFNNFKNNFDNNFINNATLLITGGTGSFGSTVLKHFLTSNIAQIRIFSRDEKKQDDMRHDLQAHYPEQAKKVKFYIGDVRNPQSVADAMPGVDFIWHAAALKQVPSCEFFPMEAVRTNIIGTDNVLHAAIEAKVKRVVCLSTDKAAYPINAMGISKAMMEHVITANARVAAERGDTVICCTRYGNVMCSRGSVIPLFIDQIKSGQPITITNPAMTRFLMNLDEAVELVRFAFTHANPGDAVGDNLGATIGNIIAKSYTVMSQLRPEAVLVLGDTNSCLSVIAAKRLHIPIFHMEAGNRCKDECLPEETNRRIVDIISDVNLPYSEAARRYLIEMGFPKERIYMTGSPMAEVLTENIDAIKNSDIHDRLKLYKYRYILLSAHREENIDTEQNFLSLFTAVNALAERYKIPILYSCHPRSRKRLEQMEADGKFKLDNRVIAHEPLGFHDYNCLQMYSFCVVSDSGTLPEESSFYESIDCPISAVCIRTSTERPEALEKGCFIISGIDTKGLLQSVELAIESGMNADCGVPVPDYTDLNVSAKVVKIIQSYVGIVNRMVWRKGI